MEGRGHEFAHQDIGDRGLLGVEAGGGHRRAYPGGEQPGEDFLLGAERGRLRFPQQDQGPGGDAMPGQRGDHDRADRPETFGHQPRGGCCRVDPAGGHRRKPAQSLPQARHIVGVHAHVRQDRRTAAQTGHHREPAAAAGRDGQRHVRETLGRQLRGHIHAAPQVEGGEQNVGRLREKLGPLPLHEQGFPCELVIGVIHQPPRHRAVAPYCGVRLETAPGDGAAQRLFGVRRVRMGAGRAEPGVCGTEPGRSHIGQGCPRDRSGQNEAGSVVASHHHTPEVGDQHRIRGPAPQGIRPRVRDGSRLSGSQILRIRWADPSPHQLDDCLKATITHAVAA